MDLVARLASGRDAFNRRAFFDAHEAWEEVWTHVDGPQRAWVQGLVQLATALHKLDRGRPDVCAKLLAKARAKLDGAPASYGGIDLASARAIAGRILSDIERGGPVDGSARLDEA